MPAIALALLVVMLGAALVIDRLWLDMAYAELQRTAEAAAWGAGHELASDDLLREDSNTPARLMKARLAAARIAAENHVAGEPLLIKTDDDGDVRFGQLIEVTGQTVFLEDEADPTTVVVNARRTSGRKSAIWLAMQTLLGPKSADVVASAEATLDNRVVGLRTVGDLPLPTLPVAIQLVATAQETESSKKSANASSNTSDQKPDNPKVARETLRKQNWTHDIEQRSGADHFGYDSSNGQVNQSSDGIPEITLRTATTGQNSQSNAHFVMLRDDLTNDDLKRQIHEGWSAHDLKDFSGELLLDRGSLAVVGLRGVNAASLNEALQAVAGQSRICLLYDHAESDENSPVAQLRCVGFVAGRVMSVQEVSETECEIVFQPAVMTSRSAVVASELSGSSRTLSEEDVEKFPKNP